MAKVAKDQMKVKGALKNYVCTWTYATPVEEWDHSTLLANLRNGLTYAIRRNINLSIATDEQSVNRNQAMVAFMTAQTKGDAAELAKMNEFCKTMNIKTMVQTEFVIREEDYKVEVEEDEDDE
jgi:hypothetical protein